MVTPKDILELLKKVKYLNDRQDTVHIKIEKEKPDFGRNPDDYVVYFERKNTTKPVFVGLKKEVVTFLDGFHAYLTEKEKEERGY